MTEKLPYYPSCSDAQSLASQFALSINPTSMMVSTYIQALVHTRQSLHYQLQDMKQKRQKHDLASISINLTDADQDKIVAALKNAPPMNLVVNHDLQDELEKERACRIAAQTENEQLKDALAHAGMELRKAIFEEREACAKACEALKDGVMAALSGDSSDLSNVMMRQVAELGHAECAIAIRARSQQ